MIKSTQVAIRRTCGQSHLQDQSLQLLSRKELYMRLSGLQDQQVSKLLVTCVHGVMSYTVLMLDPGLIFSQVRTACLPQPDIQYITPRSLIHIVWTARPTFR